MTHETPIRFFHKETGMRLVAAKADGLLCGDKTDSCKCVLFLRDCHGICFDVRAVVGYNVYFNEAKDESR